jgi:hypothetical protein
MHWHPETIIQTDTDIVRVQEAASDSSLAPSTLKMVEKVISYWTSANSLKQLHRFTDSRHPSLIQVPLPDGSNIRDASSRDPRGSLQDEWAFRRAFIRLLHLPGLWFSGEVSIERYQAFTHLYGIARCLLEFELDRCPTILIEGNMESYQMEAYNPLTDSLSWILPTRETVELALDHVGAAAYSEYESLRSRFFPNREPPVQPALTDEEILQRNLSAQFMPAMLNEMIKVQCIATR